MVDGQRHVDRIWRWYARTRSSRLRQALIEHFLPLVHRHAKRLRARLPAVVDLNDLISAGTLGLMEAIESFDVTQGTRFETFSARKIPGAMLDELRALDWAPRSVRQRSKIVAEVSNQIRVETGRNPTDAEITSRLPVAAKKRAAVLRDGRPPVQVSLSAAANQRPDGEVAAMQLPDQRSSDPQREAARAMAKEWMLRGLSRCERLILILYYYEQLSMKEIGAALDLSESRVSQIHKLLMQQLRSRLEREKANVAVEL